MPERKLIFECRVGSHLFGTSRPDSDEDFQGVFLPSTEDLFALNDYPKEWDFSTKTTSTDNNGLGDVDRKFFSLRRFCQLALQGQPGQLEMLFAPESAIRLATKEWHHITARRTHFLSKRGIQPFIGFATSQAQKATMKAENLDLIRTLIPLVKSAVKFDPRARIEDGLYGPEYKGVRLKRLCNDAGADLVEVASRQYNVGSLASQFLYSLISLEQRYGMRTRKAIEALTDYKSLMHAFRLVSEAEEFLKDGFITLPRPDAQFLKSIREGKISRDWQALLIAEIDRIETDVLPYSYLPEKPDTAYIADMCIDLHKEHVRGR